MLLIYISSSHVYAVLDTVNVIEGIYMILVG